MNSNKDVKLATCLTLYLLGALGCSAWLFACPPPEPGKMPPCDGTERWPDPCAPSLIDAGKERG